MSDDEKKLAISLPGEWAIQRVLGPVLSELGDDLKRLYAAGRDKILAVAVRKVPDPDDGLRANLRVTRDVLWNGAFTEDEVCAEYFGGILASSRSEDGSNDHVIQFVDVTKSLSAKQLHLHYVIYNRLNKLLASSQESINVGMGDEIQPKKVWFSALELTNTLDLQIETDLNVLHRAGLLVAYMTKPHELPDKGRFPYSWASPTTFGVLLYAVAHNRLRDWRTFAEEDLGDFPDVALPRFSGLSLEELLAACGLSSEQPPEVG